MVLNALLLGRDVGPRLFVARPALIMLMPLYAMCALFQTKHPGLVKDSQYREAAVEGWLVAVERVLHSKAIHVGTTWIIHLGVDYPYPRASHVDYLRQHVDYLRVALAVTRLFRLTYNMFITAKTGTNAIRMQQRNARRTKRA